MTEERVIDLTVDVPGVREEVWDAIATGPGISAWFVPFEVETRESGSVVMDFGHFGKETAEVVAWDPPHLFAYRGEGSSGNDLLYEWFVEPTDTALCTVRLRNSGFLPADRPDPDFEGMSSGWPIFLENLRLHLTHFRGQPARSITPVATVPLDHTDAWTALCAELDIAPDLVEGAKIATSGEGVPMLHGIVERTFSVPDLVSGYLVLMDAPTTGTAFIAAEGGDGSTAFSVWLYLYGDDVEEVEDRWTLFMEERWPSD
jgi:uncharacterized protein YndB with AHSA1/START domain